MVHNSFTGEYECADSYFYLVDEGVFTEGESFLRVAVDRMAPDVRKHYEHWLAVRVPDGEELWWARS
jgi:hypothetical protein